jgi:hypothetical protein
MSCNTSAISVFSSSAALRAVMSAKVMTTAAGALCPCLKTGRVLMESQVTPLSGRWTPRTRLSRAWPVHRVIMEGCSWPGQGEPSSWTRFQRWLKEVWPSASSALSPKMSSATLFHSLIRPSAV